MLADAAPPSIFQESSAWNMPLPAAVEGLKRPPVSNSGLSSPTQPRNITKPPSLTDSTSFSTSASSDQDIPPFQTFLRQTPPLVHDHDKPLPLTPSQRKESAISGLSPASRARRSSSVYSQTPSQSIPESESSWRTEDLSGDHTQSTRPLAYSTSVPDLANKDGLLVLEPRVFSPLINSPSPTLSAVTVPRSPPRSRPTTALLPPPASPVTLRRKVETVSLEKAKQARDAPGAVHLLPEELRAQTLGRAKSQGHMRVNSLEIFAGGASKVLDPPAPSETNNTLIDRQGRQRLISTPLSTPPVAITSSKDYQFPESRQTPYDNAFHVGTGPVRPMAPPAVEAIEGPNRLHTHGADNNEPRGRRMERRLDSRPTEASEYRGLQRLPTQQYSQSRESMALDLATEYTLWSQQNTYTSDASGYDSDDSIRTHMKMVSQPLFTGKQPARESGALRGNHKRSKSDESARSRYGSSSFPLHLSLSPPSSEHRGSAGSTTGIIPISPPSDHDPSRNRPPPLDTTATTYKVAKKTGAKQQKHSRAESRESQFYPHVMRRASSKQEEKELKRRILKSSIDEDAADLPPLGAPLLAAEVIAKRLETPQTTPDTSPLPSTPTTTSTHRRGPSDGSSSVKKNRTGLFSRVKGVARIGSLGGRRRSDDQELSPSSSSKPSPTSPHLYPSPVKTPRMYLGWSDSAKEEFDDTKSPTDNRKMSVVDSMLDRFQENKAQAKAEKRREELRKLIRHVPNVGTMTAEDVEKGKRRESLGKRLSGYKWV